ncbi:hypothetical protein BDV40DRAFT_274629 [Aspergillus tamarii]|uniref:Zn(2)-C6 fungal-type domain-containing protein n=1 Tax=Aspergillus tamarii TaxID=41984 RepID=A0A5N6ULC8_ASPTM|nr:hypothetical protein BDV40DRAFT_274629 [Aspergillus tamarii]
METTPRKLRKRNGPQGIQKPIASHDHRTGTIACQSCHIRKRRCTYAAQHHRCTNCLQNNYSCVPRGHVMRYAVRPSARTL